MVNKSLSIVLIAWCLASGPVPCLAQSIIDSSSLPSDEVDISKMMAQVTQDFFDPKSAQFKSLSIQDDHFNNSGKVVCGWINGKNHLGGYTDWYPFFYLPSTNFSTVFQDYGDAADGEVAAKVVLTLYRCSQALGLPTN